MPSNEVPAAGVLPSAVRARRWPRRLAAAAALVVIAGLAVAALSSGGDDAAEPTMLPAYGAATAMSRPWQQTPECDVPPRPRESFLALLIEAASGGGFAIIAPSSLQDEAGTPADAATVASIEATVRELAACRNARLVGQHYALWTDEAIVRAENASRTNRESDSLITTLLRSRDLGGEVDGTTEAVSNGVVWTVEAIKDARVLPNGLVRATVVYVVAGGELPMVTYFVEQDGVHLLEHAEGLTGSVAG